MTLPDHLMAVQCFAVGRVDAGAVDANQLYTQVGQGSQSLGCKCCELGIKFLFGKLGVGSHQNAF